MRLKEDIFEDDDDDAKTARPLFGPGVIYTCLSKAEIPYLYKAKVQNRFNTMIFKALNAFSTFFFITINISKNLSIHSFFTQQVCIT